MTRQRDGNTVRSHVIARLESSSVSVITCSKQSKPHSLIGKIASKFSIINHLRDLMPRNDVKRGKFYSLFIVPCSLRLSPIHAFTLAEVLVTLGIIGMVAEMTIPTLMGGVEKQQTVVRLQKAYSELAQTKALAEVDNGMVANWDFADASLDETKHYVNNYVYPYMKTIKKCDNGDTSCWKDTVSLDNSPTTATWRPASSELFGVSAIMAGGYSVYFTSIGLAANPYKYIYIDIDGPVKGPGRYGRDVFGFRARFLAAGNGNLRPIGWADVTPITRADAVGLANYGCSKAISGGSAGIYCAALIMVDNWKIADDYPWK